MTDIREIFRPDDHPNDHFLLTTVVGSYPKPAWLDHLREAHEDDEVDEDDWQEALDDAARLIVDEHERAGLDAVVDGEMRRTEMVEYFADRIEGYQFNGPVKVWGHNYFDKPSVVEEVQYDEPWLLDEFEFTDDVADGPVKIPITGPYTLARWSFDEHYGSEEELTYALADLVREELATLIDAGAQYIQIDEPALATTPDDHAIVGEAVSRIVEDVPDDVRIGMHVCYGDYSRIFPEALSYPVHEFDVELSNNDFEHLSTFKEVDFTKDFAAGVVDAHDARVESVGEIKSNIKRSLEVVPPDRLTVSPDCGLKLLPREVAFEKTRNLVRAAREVEAELDEGSVDLDSSAWAETE